MLERARPRGRCPRAPAKGNWLLLDSHLFWGVWGAEFQSLPRWYFLRGRSPAYPLFRKEKVRLYERRNRCDAESFERVLLRSYSVRRRKYPARRRELFSLRKKRTAGIRLSAWQKAGSLYRLNPPFSALKKPLKLRVPRGFNPLGRRPAGSCPSRGAGTPTGDKPIPKGEAATLYRTAAARFYRSLSSSRRRLT